MGLMSENIHLIWAFLLDPRRPWAFVLTYSSSLRHAILVDLTALLPGTDPGRHSTWVEIVSDKTTCTKTLSLYTYLYVDHLEQAPQPPITLPENEQ